MRIPRRTPGPAVRPPPDPYADRPLVVLLALGLLLALAAGTQFVAWRFGFHRDLGAPLVIFAPHTVRLLRVAALLATGGVMLALRFPRLRLFAGPRSLIAVCAAIGRAGPVYAPHRFGFCDYCRAPAP